ncbi:MAG: ABC transporter ATP-binding protein [Deltaproteobacteria bacterium]|jgi:iron complex transport system ATP-binding protein|nr:ABC transporter ATP-binding protein [Deltaproteobacteria bacterium]
MTAASSKTVLSVQGLSYSIGAAQILVDVDFSAEEGGFVSVVGPNGAGKSTLLRCLMRLPERGRTRGRVEAAGRPLEQYSQKELARLISYVPQAGGWIPPFTVGEFVLLSRFPYATAVSSLAESDRRAAERALELTGLTALAKRPLKNLSGGERQKAFLAAALAQEAQVMLLDEPASFLDPRHAAELAGLLRALNREEGLTMIMVTHDLNHPLRAGGHALVLAEGRRRYFGPVEGLLEGSVLEEAFRHNFVRLDHPNGLGRVILPE